MEPEKQMTPERFAELAEAYGGDLTAWPATARAAAEAHMTARPEAAETLREAAALDALLADDALHAPAPAPSEALLARVLADAAAAPSASRSAEQPKTDPPNLWRALFGDLSPATIAGAFGVAAAAGVIVGVIAPLESGLTTPFADPTVVASNATDWFGGADDADAFL